MSNPKTVKQKQPNEHGLRFKKASEIEINLNQKINSLTLISYLQNKIPARDLLELIDGYLLHEKGSFLTTMRSFLATKEDVADVESMILLRYVLDNWDKVLKEATKYWRKRKL